MKSLPTIVLLLLISPLTKLLNAQNIGDTIEVRAFNYTQTHRKTNIRDTIIDFSGLPDVSFEKVLLYYNMRCKDGKVSPPVQGRTNDGCGEWDYSNNTFIHDPNKADSVLANTNKFSISNTSKDTFNYTTEPIYDIIRYTRDKRQINSINNEDIIGLYGNPDNEYLIGSAHNGKIIIIVDTTTLKNIELKSGAIDGITLSSLSEGRIENLVIKTYQDENLEYQSLSEYSGGLQEVYNSDVDFTIGENKLYFTTPLEIIDTLDLLIEFSFTSNELSDEIKLEATNDASSIANIGEYALNLSAGGMVMVDNSDLNDISNEITIAFWAKGDSSLLPRNTSVIHALDESGQRSLNIHFPWSNSRIYWDSGNEGNQYDRIDKESSKSVYANTWNHWTFTKNTITGSMKIYLNGVLWHSGVDKSRVIEIAELVIGASNNGSNPYKGMIDEFMIWDKELSPDYIQRIASSELSIINMESDSLKVYYDFNELNSTVCVNKANESSPGTYNNKVVWDYGNGRDLQWGLIANSSTPIFKFVSGEYDSETVSEEYEIKKARTPNFITEREIYPFYGETKSDSIVELNTIKAWDTDIPSYTYSEDGEILEENQIDPDAIIINKILPYYQRWPARFEIMSFVTPYGIRLDLGDEGKTWVFDITEYLPILKDQRRMTMEYGGQWQEDMDIRFLFIVGTPPADVISIDQMWRNQQRNYSQINNDTYFPPRDFYMDPEGDRYIVKSTITGHGPEGEFMPRFHQIEVGETPEIFRWRVWTECSENPVYPQGGTWIYDRAGWCPGAPSDIHYSDITPYVQKGEFATIDYDMDVASGDSRYIVNHQLITYGEPNHDIDAAIIEVREPSNRVEYARFNPSVDKPKVVLQNSGSIPLQSARIRYWLNNSNDIKEFDWNGELGFMESEVVELSTDLSFWVGVEGDNNIFNVEVMVMNDEYSNNNSYHSTFSVPPRHPANMKLVFKSNAAAFESSYRLYDSEGNIIFENNNLNSNAVHNEEFALPIGLYTFEINDTGDDGIDFWNNNDGSGYVFLTNKDGAILKDFEMDFGGSIRYNFIVEDHSSVADNMDQIGLSIYPNPSSDMITITSEEGFSGQKYKLVDTEGRVITEGELPSNFSINASLDISSIATGYYILEVEQLNGSRTSHGFIKN